MDLFCHGQPGSVELRIWKNQVRRTKMKAEFCVSHLVQISKNKKFYPVTTDELISNFMSHHGRSAAILNPNVFKMWLKNNRKKGCSLLKTQRPIEVKFALAVSLECPYLEAINYQVTYAQLSVLSHHLTDPIRKLSKMRESGIISHHRRKSIDAEDMSPDYLCKNSREVFEGSETPFLMTITFCTHISSSEVGICSVQGVFILLSVGIFLGLTIIVAEKIVKYNANNRHDQSLGKSFTLY
jgi:hypothetical protein